MEAPATVRPAAALTDSRAASDTRNCVPSVSPRTQRTVVDGLRAVARRSRGQGRRRRFEVLLTLRAAAVHDELLSLAALLDIIDDPDPSAIDALLGLLTDGCESPLYNPAVHASALYATLIDVSRRLTSS